MFTTWADVCVLNRSPGGLLDYGTLASVGLGILVAFLSGGRYLWLLLIWVGVTFVVGVAFTDAPRASYRMAAAMPAVFLLAGVGVSHMLSAAGGSRWYRCVVHPLVGLVLAGWITWQNYQLFFVRYAAGDGREVPGSAQLRFMEAHCDGRVFYTFGNEPPGPETRLFCSDLKTVRPGQLAASLDLTSPATFFVAESQRLVLERLRFCFPTADYVPHQGHDGRLLFTRVDVPVTELIARYQTCPG